MATLSGSYSATNAEANAQYLVVSAHCRDRTVHSVISLPCLAIRYDTAHPAVGHMQVILSGEATAEDVSTTKIADNTEGFSGNDLRQLCTAAAMCGIRELMKATSKAARDKAAAAKRAKHAAQSPPSADRQNGPQSDSVPAESSQLTDQQNGAAQLTRSAADQGGSSHAKDVPLTTAAAGLAAERQGQAKPSKGNKRDNEEGAGSTTTKRLKSSADSITESTTDGLHASTADSASGGTQTATDSDQKQSSDGTPSSSTLEPSTASDQAQASSRDEKARKAENSEQGSPGTSGGHMVKHVEQQQQGQPEASGRRSVDWLLAKYKDVAAAADQQVSTSEFFAC